MQIGLTRQQAMLLGDGALKEGEGMGAVDTPTLIYVRQRRPLCLPY